MALRVALAGQVGIETASGGAGAGGFVDTGGLGRLGRVAFAYLVSERQRPVPRDELAEVLWGDDLPRTWDTSLRGVVSKLRTWLAGAGLDRASALVSAFGCYQLHLPDDTAVDVEEAADQLDAARTALAAGDAPGARAHAAAAAATAGQDFLPGATGAWIEQQQAQLRDLRVAALEALADAARSVGDGPAALAAAEEAVGIEPLRESAHLRVMAAHAATGNRGEALRAYERLRRVLADELGVSPSPHTEATYLALLQDEAVTAPAAGQGPAAPPAGPAVRLPASVSSFVGRETEVAEVAALVRSGRLVTLVGAGGLGKTRLALEVGRLVAPDLADGAVMVGLAELSDPAAVASQAVTALGLADVAGRSPLDTLSAALADRHLLLLLDNCEHLVAAAADLVEALLRASPRLVVLATSREPLRVPGETVWGVPPLATEDARRLLVERATAVHPSGASPLDQADVDVVCRRLDGIPLAIELAAARTDVLSLAEIAARLDDRFQLLTGGARTAPRRQQTLRGAIDWSYDSLEEPERHLFHRVAVFAGGFTLGAVERIAPGEDALDRLAALVSRSLVLAEPAGPGGRSTRYRLPETIRAYAADKLEASGEAPAVRARLLRWAADVAEEADAHLDGPDQAAWLDRLDAEHANLRAALAVDPASADALRLATALGRFWEIRGHLHEGRQWLRTILAESDGGPPLLRARAHNAAALLAQHQGDYAAARSRLEESLAIREREGDRLGAAVALHGLGNLAALQHDTGAARDVYRQSLAIGRELGDPALAAAALDNLGWVAHVTADFAAARAAYEEALAVRREVGDLHGIALVLGHLGDLAYQQGDYALAASLHTESLQLHTSLGDRAGRADSLATLGHLAMHDGDLSTAGARLEESLAIRRDLGDRAALPGALTSLGDLALLAGDVGAARARLEEAAAVAAANRDQITLAHVLVHQGRVARAEGRTDQAATRYAESRRAAGDLAPDPVTAEWLEGVGATLAMAGDVARGARLLGAADGLRSAIGAPVPPHERPAHDRDVAQVQSALGASAFEEAWQGGRALPLALALAEALDSAQLHVMGDEGAE